VEKLAKEHTGMHTKTDNLRNKKERKVLKCQTINIVVVSLAKLLHVFVSFLMESF
jgi:hypothetical protein